MSEKNEYAALAPYYDLFIDWERRLALELPFLLETLPTGRANLRCLDIGCGTGRHLERLRAAGLTVTGCEPSPALRIQAERNLPGATIYPHRMEHLGELAAEQGPWDLVLCLGNTLAHLPVEKRTGFFAALAAAVAPGGKAVLHLLGYDRIVRERPASLAEKTVEHENRRYVFSRDYAYLDEGIEFTLRIAIDGQPAGEQRERLYPLAGEALNHLLTGSGFGKIDMYDGFNPAKPYNQNSVNLVSVATR